jgi:hypothetical protein
MKARFVILLVVMASAASQTALAQITTVQYSEVETGSSAICFNAAFTAETACTNPTAIAAPVTLLSVGHGERNAQGGCHSFVTTISALPPQSVAPSVSNTNTVYQITDYDSSTGAGDYSFTQYTGGQCVGVNFNSSGATLVSTGTKHFQDSENGNRRDSVVTSLTNPTNSTGTFSLHEVQRALVPTLGFAALGL